MRGRHRTARRPYSQPLLHNLTFLLFTLKYRLLLEAYLSRLGLGICTISTASNRYRSRPTACLSTTWHGRRIAWEVCHPNSLQLTLNFHVRVLSEEPPSEDMWLFAMALCLRAGPPSPIYPMSPRILGRGRGFQSRNESH
ncbi:hypothetical protein K469DRAFT_264566 [Zopfia rhizophila CBS 207.26]|uniref:Uncharacterized protein n=1 Tax=Zopfia rhizophila CBS 207.26 TaxID=1314779 RepID=A0A6A6DQ06_9PEZI|nr:hypothetical protein K469DRAFT_264566 [Zopfia rhizophila CBS 207.26]